MRPATPKASDSGAVSAMGGALEWLNPSNDGPFNILSGSCRGSAMEQLLLGWAHAHTRGNRTTRFRMRTSSAKQHNIIQNKIRNMKLPQQLLALNFCRFGGFCGSVIPVFYYRPYPLVFLFFCAFARLRSLFPLILAGSAVLCRYMLACGAHIMTCDLCLLFAPASIQALGLVPCHLFWRLLQERWPGGINSKQKLVINCGLGWTFSWLADLLKTLRHGVVLYIKLLQSRLPIFINPWMCRLRQCLEW